MKDLFSPFELLHLKLANRIVMPGLASFLIEKDGTITDKTVEHYRKRAAGGPAMVIMEACAVSPEGIVSPHQARIYDDRFIEGLSRIARVMKAEGSIPAVQLHHGGRQTSARVIKRRPVAPSNLPCPAISGEVEPLTMDGIQEIVEKFGKAAERAVEAGFELVEIHGAHGYLVNQFLSEYSNIREDQYGGDVKGRSRFAVEIVQEIRRRIGEDFPLSFKISAQEFVPRGLTTEESLEIVKLLVQVGINIVQVSAGNDATPEWISQPMFMEKGCLVESAEKIKKALGIPVMAVGRINDPLLADAIIREKRADLVCIGRGLLADPEMPLKAKEGRLDEIRTCIACNTCMESIFRKGRVECLVNPTLGREKEMEIIPAGQPKKVMVIGGGPGGLNVAWVAAKRGHRVLLFEKGSALGGQLLLGSMTNHKKEVLSLIEFLKIQVRKTGVECRLNEEAGISTVKDINPDVVVLATGSTPVLPPIEGIDGPNVFDLFQALNHGGNAEGNAVVIGGGASGCEVALHLAEKGHSVFLIEKLPKIGKKIESVTRKMILQKLAEYDVKLMTECEVEGITPDGLFVLQKNGERQFIPAQRIIPAVGNRSYTRLYDEIKSIGIPVFQIGDCIEPRSAKAAIYEGAVIGRAI